MMKPRTRKTSQLVACFPNTTFPSKQKTGNKNQDIIVTKKRIIAQIHFWITPISVTDQWKPVMQGCIQSCKAFCIPNTGTKTTLRINRVVQKTFNSSQVQPQPIGIFHMIGDSSFN